MRRVSVVAVLFVNLLLLALAPQALARQAAPPTASGCVAGRNAPALTAARWHPDVDATVYYQPGAFTREERRAFAEAVADWRAAVERRGSRASLRESDAAPPADPAGEGVIVVGRDAHMAEDRWGEVRGTNSRDGYITAAAINISGRQHKLSTLRRLLAHELGHAFGLADCPACGRGSSVMALFGRAKLNGIRLGLFDSLLDRAADRPTRCDEAQSSAGYAKAEASTAALSLGAPLGDHGDRAGAAYEEAQWEHLDAKRLDTSAPEVGEGRRLIEGTPVGTSGQSEEGRSLAAKLLSREAETVGALRQYTFTREVLIETLDERGRVTGEYRRVSRMVLADDGTRYERLVSFPKPTLKRLRITKEDLEDLAGTQMLGLEASLRGRYVVSYEGRAELEGKRCLLFSVTPADLARAKAEGVRVFYGKVWADEETLEIVRAQGRSLPEGNQRFPAFELRRAPAAGPLMFPAAAFGEDTLVFPDVSIRMRLSVRYTDFRKFVTDVKIIEEGEVTDGELK